MGGGVANRTLPLEGQRRAAFALLLSVGLTVGLYALPYPYDRYLGYPLMLLSTLAHELGHGVAGLLVGGDFDSFALHANGSGVARVSGYSGRIARAIVSGGGLVGPAVVAALFFLVARWSRVSRWSLVGVGALLVVAEVLVVRNLFGWAFVGLVAGAALALGLRASAKVCQVTLLFLAVQLSLSVFSRGDYLFTEVARTSSGTMPSDVANMATALLLPYWFWGATCGALSVLVLIVGLWVFLQGPFPQLRLRGSLRRGRLA